MDFNLKDNIGIIFKINGTDKNENNINNFFLKDLLNKNALKNIENIAMRDVVRKII